MSPACMSARILRSRWIRPQVGGVVWAQQERGSGGSTATSAGGRVCKPAAQHCAAGRDATLSVHVHMDLVVSAPWAPCASTHTNTSSLPLLALCQPPFLPLPSPCPSLPLPAFPSSPPLLTACEWRRGRVEHVVVKHTGRIWVEVPAVHPVQVRVLGSQPRGQHNKHRVTRRTTREQWGDYRRESYAQADHLGRGAWRVG